MLKQWFSLICTILFVNLVILLSNFNLRNVLHWIAFVILIVAITMTLIIYLKHKNNKTIDLESTYNEFLKQKDKQIEELQNKNELMLKTALKRSGTDIELAELKKKWEDKMK